MGKAIKQDFKNPARLGILLGASMAPVAGMAAASCGLMHNGFVMAGIGSTESIVAGLTVHLARKKMEFDYERNLQRSLEKKEKKRVPTVEFVPAEIV